MRRILILMKREVFQLLKLIAVYYDSFELQQEKVDEWYCVLQGEPFQWIKENLRRHVARSPYPPRVSELVCKPENGHAPFPIMRIHDSSSKFKERPASKEVVEQSLAQIREILGIQERDKLMERSRYYCIEVEEAVIGALFLDGELIKECTLVPEHFYSPQLQKIFMLMGQLAEKGKPIDVVSVAEEAGPDGFFEIGGGDYLPSLADSVARLQRTSRNAYQEIVEEMIDE